MVNKMYVKSVRSSIFLSIGELYEFSREVDEDRIEVITSYGEKQVMMKYNFEVEENEKN